MFEPLSALVRLRREQLGLSIDALSALSRVSRTRLIALEKGEDNISLDLLVKVANALELKEIRIGALRLGPASPDFMALVAAAEAVLAARNVVDQAIAASGELDRVAGPVSELLAPVLPPPPRLERSSTGGPNLETIARLLRRSRARKPA